MNSSSLVDIGIPKNLDYEIKGIEEISVFPEDIPKLKFFPDLKTLNLNGIELIDCEEIENYKINELIIDYDDIAKGSIREMAKKLDKLAKFKDRVEESILVYVSGEYKEKKLD